MARADDAPFPLFVVPGMPRAGTTFLYHYLQQHPAIFLPFRKEIDYFNSLYRFKGRSWYESLFREIGGGQIAGDLSPSCWHDAKTADYIKTFNAHAKVILALRDPAEYAVSLYAQKSLSGYDVPRSLHEFISEGYELRLSEKGGSVFFRFENRDFLERVEQYRDTFGANLLLYDFDFFRRNQLTILRAIEDFLGLENYFHASNFDNQRVNASQRRNVRFLHALTAQEWFRNLVERCVPRRWVMSGRSFLDRISVKGAPSKAPKPIRHSPEELQLVRDRLQPACTGFRQLFEKAPVLTGDGREFPLRSHQAKAA